MRTRFDFLRIVYAGLWSVLTFSALMVDAAVREWTGDKNLDNSWTQPQNWVSNLAPNAGDDLLFPTLARHPQNQNNYAPDTTFNSIELRGGGPWTGYNIGGNSIALNAGIKVENNSGGPVDHTINNAFLLNSNQTFTINNDVGSFSLTGPINLNGKVLTVNVLASLATTFSGQLSGSGGLVKTGAGPLTLSGNSSYTGPTTLSGGSLWINGSQPSSAVQLVSGTLRGTGTVGSVTSTGAGDPGSIVLSPGASPGILSCSNLAFNSSTVLEVELNGTTPGTGHDQLNVTGSVNPGYAGLSVSFGFSPAIGDSFIIIANDAADPVAGIFKGLPEGATFAVGPNTLRISYVAGSGNDVSLTAVVPPSPPITRTWDGGGADANWTTAPNWIGDLAPSLGDDLVFPAGPTRLVVTNDYGAGKPFNSISVSNGGYVLRGSRIALNAGIMADFASGLLEVHTPFTLVSNQTFAARTGSMFLNAQTDLGGNALTLWTDSEIQTTQPGTIVGSGRVIKTGPGIVTFGGTHTYAGLTEIREGELRIVVASSLGSSGAGTVVSNGAILSIYGGQNVAEPLELHGRLSIGTGNGTLPSTWIGPIVLGGNGAQLSAAAITPRLTISGGVSGSGSLTKIASGDIVLAGTNTYSGPTTNAGGRLFIDGYQPQGPVFLVSGTFSGTGVVGVVTSTSFPSKFLTPGGPAVPQGILTCSNVVLSDSTAFQANLNGSSPGTGYDQLVVRGTVGLGDAILSVLTGFDPVPGSAFTIIDNDGTDPVQGTFNSLPEGAIVSAGGKSFQISYAGGTGNDVVLTLYSPAFGFVSITNSPSGYVTLQATGGIPGLSYSILAATNLGSSIVWSNIGSAVANGGGIFSFSDTNAPFFPMRFYRGVSP